MKSTVYFHCQSIFDGCRNISVERRTLPNGVNTKLFLYEKYDGDCLGDNRTYRGAIDENAGLAAGRSVKRVDWSQLSFTVVKLLAVFLDVFFFLATFDDRVRQFRRSFLLYGQFFTPGDNLITSSGSFQDRYLMETRRSDEDLMPISSRVNIDRDIFRQVSEQCLNLDGSGFVEYNTVVVFTGEIP